MENQRKEIEISKSFISRIINRILNALALSFIILIIVQHFGTFSREYNYHYYSGEIVSSMVTFKSPLSEKGNLYHPKVISKSNNDEDVKLDYSEKFFKVYAADLIDNHKTKFFILFIVTLILIYSISNLKNKYSIKLT